MKHDPCVPGCGHFTTPLDEVTLEDVRRFQALANRTVYAETRKICLKLIAEYYRQHPEHAPQPQEGNAA